MYVKKEYFFNVFFTRYHVLSSRDAKERPTAMLLKEKRRGYALIYARCAPNNVVRFRGSLMAAAGALITTKYGPISPPGAVAIGSFCDFQPTGILSERNTAICPSLVVLPPTDASVLSYIDVMSAAMKVDHGSTY